MSRRSRSRPSRFEPKRIPTGRFVGGREPAAGVLAAVAGPICGTVTLTPSVLASLVDRVTSLIIHTVNLGGGEIRGQVLR